MRNRSMGRLVGIGLAASGLAMGVLAGPAISGAVTAKAGSTLTVALTPGSDPQSVFPFYTAGQCTTVNIDYWDLQVRPGYWFGLGSSVAIQPSLSPLNQPTYANAGANTAISFTLKGWTWSDGNGHTRTMDAQDVAFFLNMERAQSTQGAQGNAFCGDAPGFGIPDQVVSVAYPHGLSGNAVTITLKGHPSHLWILYNELSQIVPMTTAWDTTNGSNNGGCSTEAFTSVIKRGGTEDNCSKVFDYLSGLQMNNTLWNWADGPYRQNCPSVACPEYSGGSPDGNDVQVANGQYSGPVHAHAVQTVLYKPYADTQTEITDLQTNKLSFGYVDPSDVTKSPGPGKAGSNTLPNMGGYKTVGSVTYGVFYWQFNFGNKNSTWPAASTPWARLNNQQYFRAALSYAENQAGAISHFQNGYAVPTFSAIPTYPKNSFNAGVKPSYPYSTSKGKLLMKAHGWNVSKFPAVCAKTNCGSSKYPIHKGEKATEKVQVPNGDPAVTNETNYEVQTIKANSDIQIIPDYRPANNVAGDCFAGAALWEICGYGGWIYAPDYYPSGEVLFAAGSGSNAGGYVSAEMQGLVNATTISGNVALNATNPKYHTSFAQFSSTDVPFLWQPTPTGFIEQAKSIAGAQLPNPLSDFNPEYITAI